MKTFKQYVITGIFCFASLVVTSCPNEVTPHEHKWGKWTAISRQATCETPGYGTRKCACGLVDSDHTIPALGHDWGEWYETTAATCTTAGVETGTCSHDERHKGTRPIPALGHNWGAWEIITEPTCTEEGSKTGTCVRDETHKETFSVQINALGHDWEWTVTSPITSLTTVQATGTCVHDHTHTKTFNDDLRAYLSMLPPNTVADPYTLVLNLSDLGGSCNTSGSLGNMIDRDKYVNLDLSGSTFTSIPDSAFDYWYRGLDILTGITIPDTVTSIRYRAFSYCSSLASVNIPSGVTSIGNSAFSNCTSLASVAIPDSVTSIGDGAFSYCSSLASVGRPWGGASVANCA
jgi:hypothetical protein